MEDKRIQLMVMNVPAKSDAGVYALGTPDSLFEFLMSLPYGTCCILL